MSPVVEKLLTILLSKLVAMILPKVEKAAIDWVHSIIQKLKDHASTEEFKKSTEKDQSRDERQKSEDDFINS